MATDSGPRLAKERCRREALSGPRRVGDRGRVRDHVRARDRLRTSSPIFRRCGHNAASREARGTTSHRRGENHAALQPPMPRGPNGHEALRPAGLGARDRARGQPRAPRARSETAPQPITPSSCRAGATTTPGTASARTTTPAPARRRQREEPHCSKRATRPRRCSITPGPPNDLALSCRAAERACSDPRRPRRRHRKQSARATRALAKRPCRRSRD